MLQYNGLTKEQVEDVHSGTIYYDSCNLLISGTGALNDWKWPNIPGLSEFKGKLLHSASWDETYDWTVRTRKTLCH
jgi:cation diffusion facilitator CzcD-associated flavoprotein CzcO